MTSYKVTMTGRVWRGDTSRVLDKAIGAVIVAVAKEGVKQEKAELTKGRGVDSGVFKRTIKRKKRGQSATVYAKNKMISQWLQDGGSTFKRRTKFRGYDIWTPAYRRTDRTAGEEARRTAASIVRQLSRR